MSDQPDKPEDGDSASGEPPVPQPKLLKAEEVHLADPDVSDDAVEPTLSTSAEEVQLTEPALGAAEISDDAAAAASLNEAAAEAESVAQEAENVGTLISGPRPAHDPAEAAAPAGTAPAGGAAGDAAGDTEPDPRELGEPSPESESPLPESESPPPESESPSSESESEGGADTGTPEDSSHAPTSDQNTDEPSTEASSEHAPHDAAGNSEATVDPDAMDRSIDDVAETPEEDAANSGLTSYAAAGDAPTWVGQNGDQERWDALFESEDLPAAATPASADAPRVDSPSEHEGDAGPEAPQAARAPEPETQDYPRSPAAPDAPWTSAAPDAPWAAPGPPPYEQSSSLTASPVGGPYGLPPAGPDDAAPTRVRARAVRSASRGPNRKMLIILGVVALAVVALLIVAITAIVGALRSDDPGAEASSSTTPGADGIIAEGISPLDLESGDCVLDFNSTDVSADVTTVSCTTPHNAQLLATTSLPEGAEFPGEAALNASGDELCNSVPIDENAATDYPSLTLTQVTPTTGTWADGDRRIDCFVVSDEGRVITDSLLAD